MPAHRLLVAADVSPDFGGVGAPDALSEIVGALLTLVLVASVLMLVVCAVVWAVASSAGNYQTAARSRTGLWVAVGAAVLAGAALGWTNFLLDLGTGL